jgi:hypothetical protein
MKTLASKIIRLLYPFGSQRTVLCGPLKGMKFVVELGNGFSYALGRGLNFEFLQSKIESGAVVYDVGANRGQMTLYFAKMVGPQGHVHSFEPAPVPFVTLQKHITLNQLQNVTAHQCIAAETEGSALFTFLMIGHPRGGSLAWWGAGQPSVTWGIDRD